MRAPWNEVLNDRRYRIISGSHLHGLPIGQVFHGYINDGVVFLDAGQPNHTQCDPADVQFVGFNHREPPAAVAPDPDDLATIGDDSDDLPMP